MADHRPDAVKTQELNGPTQAERAWAPSDHQDDSLAVNHEHNQTHPAAGPVPAAHTQDSINAAPAPPSYDSTEAYAPTTDKTTGQSEPQKPTLVTPLTSLPRHAATVDCPRCRRAVQTRTEKHVGDRATIWSVVICLCVGCLCAWIPCVMDDCKDVEHFCTGCNMRLATVEAGGAVQIDPAVKALTAAPTQYTNGPNASQQYAAPAGMQQATGATTTNEKQ